MPGTFDEQDPDAEWTGRPQDDPRREAAFKAAIAESRRKKPPINCWIDAPLRLDLFVDGQHRAQVDRRSALISILDEQGSVMRSFTYLRSESAYDVVESHLGIARIKQVRDESEEGWGNSSRRPRAQEEREAGRFRSRYYSDEEIMFYLWKAAGSLDEHAVSTDPAKAACQQHILDSIVALVKKDYDKALSMAQLAVDKIPEDERSGFASFSWFSCFPNCARAVVALERFIEIQRRPGGKL